MRSILLSLALVGIVTLAAPAAPSAAVVAATPTISAAPVYALQVEDKKIEITVGDRGGGVHWYRSPIWIAIGALAVVVILLLVVIAARGGGTTIIRE